MNFCLLQALSKISVCVCIRNFIEKNDQEARNSAKSKMLLDTMCYAFTLDSILNLENVGQGFLNEDPGLYLGDFVGDNPYP